MPAVRFRHDIDRRCWSKRGDRTCELDRDHLGMHRSGDVRWTDVGFAEGALDVDTNGRL